MPDVLITEAWPLLVDADIEVTFRWTTPDGAEHKHSEWVPTSVTDEEMVTIQREVLLAIRGPFQP
jgi:hypothetical protein